MLDDLFCFAASDDQTTIAVGERRATKALTNVGAHSLGGLEELSSMKQPPRAVRESNDIGSKLLSRIQNDEIAMLLWHADKLRRRLPLAS